MKMDELDDAELLRRWHGGDEAAADEAAADALLGRRLRDADVDQKLLTRCVRGEPTALTRLVERYLKDLDPGLCARLCDDGRLQRALAARDGDLPLLARWVAGNRGSADTLFERYYPMLDRFVTSKVGNPDEARDIVQETFKDLTRQHRTIQSFRPFMFKVAANKVKAWFCERYNGKVDTGVSGISNLPMSSGNDLEAIAADRTQRKLLLLALRKLPLDHQMLLELYTWEDLTAPEVADILGIPLHTVKYILRRAKESMRAFIAEHGERAARDVATTELVQFLDALHARSGDPELPSEPPQTPIDASN